LETGLSSVSLRGNPIRGASGAQWQLVAVLTKGPYSSHHVRTCISRSTCNSTDYFFPKIRPAIEKALKEGNKGNWPLGKYR
jgi:hypothetical protein